MKLKEMADLLSGIGTTMEPFMGKTAVNDLQLVSDCFRSYPEESVSSFCTYIRKVQEGKTSARSKPSANGARVDEFVKRIEHYLQHRSEYDTPAVREFTVQMNKLTISDIKAIGESIGCPLSEKTKKKMLERLENWLLNLKLSDEQSSFSLTRASVG